VGENHLRRVKALRSRSQLPPKMVVGLVVTTPIYHRKRDELVNARIDSNRG
jgi:hypothetical protein